MSKLSVYVAGPLSRGDWCLNVRKACDVEHELRRAGFYPYVPHRGVVSHFVHPEPYETWLEEDFYWLEKCDAVLRFPGESPGADREIEHAKALGKPVFFSLDEVNSWRADRDAASAPRPDGPVGGSVLGGVLTNVCKDVAALKEQVADLLRLDRQLGELGAIVGDVFDLLEQEQSEPATDADPSLAHVVRPEGADTPWVEGEEPGPVEFRSWQPGARS